jgi:ABC-type branched-subunit amino acid transport system ATPase component
LQDVVTADRANAAQDAAAPSLLELSGVSRAFGGIRAVNNVTFAIARGAATGLIGPNGAGKTTLFNLLTGMDRPDAGEIRYEGRRIDRMPASRVSRLGIGRTFQSVRVFGDMTVRENLRVADMNGRHSAEAGAEARIGAALALVDMTPHLDAAAGLLSYGQRKLVELAMVLVQAPRLILLDEPVAGVNPVLTEKIREILAGLTGRGHTLLVVEHNVPFVTRLCERIIVMANGGLLADGTAGSIQADPRVLEAFLGGQ